MTFRLVTKRPWVQLRISQLLYNNSTQVVYIHMSSFHSAVQGDLFIPWIRTTKLGRQRFSLQLSETHTPPHLCSPYISRQQFRPGVKTQLFSEACADDLWEVFVEARTELNICTSALVTKPHNLVLAKGLTKHSDSPTLVPGIKCFYL